MEANICNEKRSLVEKLGVFIETKDKLAPVAARILSYVILTGKAGTTFEDLVSKLCASKSTISTHLHHLLDLKKIVYFTKLGDRKKYFIMNQDTMLQGIDDMTEIWSVQKELHIEIKNYKVKSNSNNPDENSKFDLGFHDDYIEFLDEVTKSVLKLRTKIVEKKH